MTNFENIPEIKRWLDTGSINFFGLPFAGKDSQARRLAQRFGGTVLSSGDIFRNSVIPPETKAMIDRGELAPTQDFINIVLPYLQKPEFAALPLMLSSVGRWHGEEEGVIGALESANHPLKAVVYLSLAEEIAFKRLVQEDIVADRGNRIDDDEDKLVTRIEEFKEKTFPVINYYREKGLLIEVDASLPKDTVEQEILDQLARRANS